MTWTISPWGSSDNSLIIGLISAPLPVNDSITILGLLVIAILFIGWAEIILPLPMVTLYSNPLLSVTVASSYPEPEFAMIVSTTPTGVLSDDITSDASFPTG